MDHAVAERDRGRHVDLVRRGGRGDAADEQEFVRVDVAEAGDVPLVEESDVRGARVGRDPSHGLRRVPVGTEQVGAEVSDDPILVGGRQHLDHREVEPDGVGTRDPDDRPRLERRTAPPLAGTVHVPPALHLEVRVERVGADAFEQVLPARDHLVHRLAAEVGGGAPRDADVEPRHLAAGERGRELRGRAVNGVALRHGRPRGACLPPSGAAA